MRTSTRWSLGALAVAVALIAALAVQIGREGPGTLAGPPSGTGQVQRGADTPESLAGPRRRAGLPPCPDGRGGAGPAELRAVVVECAADGAPVDVARALAGRTVVLNLWAYWCTPCAEELPALADYQERVGDTVTVVTVHQDPNEAAGLLRMAELGVRLPMLQDGRRDIAAALAVPNVMPATVVLASDGSVAGILARAFTSADEIAAAVEAALL